MAHAYTTVLNVARSGANIELSNGSTAFAHTTLLEVGRIVVQLGSHAIIDVSKHAATTAEEIAKIGGRNRHRSILGQGPEMTGAFLLESR